jgi:hypothetical protein
MVASDSPAPRPGASPHGSCGALRRQRIRRKAGTGRYGGCDPCDRCLEPQGSEVKSASPDAADGHKPSRTERQKNQVLLAAPSRGRWAPSSIIREGVPQFSLTILPHSSRRETLRAARGSSTPEPDLSWVPGAESPPTSATPRTPQPAARSALSNRCPTLSWAQRVHSAGGASG